MKKFEDIPEGLRNCSNCAVSEDWERTDDNLHYVITKTCRACLLGTLHKDLPYPFMGWLPQYRDGVFIWVKQVNGDLCPMNGDPVRILVHGDTCDGCDYAGKMSYVSGDDMLTSRCHYVLTRNCANCKYGGMRPLKTKKCDGCIGHHYWECKHDHLQPWHDSSIMCLDCHKVIWQDVNGRAYPPELEARFGKKRKEGELTP